MGFVFSPSSGPLSGFNFSIDYYDIQLDKAITNLNGSNIANLCISGVRAFCDLFTFNAAGDPDCVGCRLDQPRQLPAERLRPAAGLFAPTSVNGRWSISYTGTFVNDSIVETGLPGSAPVDRAGEHGAANFAAVPDFRGNLTTAFRTPTWSGTLQAVHVSSGRLDNLYNTPGNPTINKNDIPSYVLFNVYGSYNLSDKIRAVRLHSQRAGSRSGDDAVHGAQHAGLWRLLRQDRTPVLSRLGRHLLVLQENTHVPRSPGASLSGWAPVLALVTRRGVAAQAPRPAASFPRPSRAARCVDARCYRHSHSPRS